MKPHEHCVYVAKSVAEANQVRAFLGAAGIPSMIRGESVAKTLGLAVDGLVRMEVLVTEADEERARALLASAEAGAFRLEENSDPESA